MNQIRIFSFRKYILKVDSFRINRLTVHLINHAHWCQINKEKKKSIMHKKKNYFYFLWT